ncbi:MAG: hypothetical protein LBG17_09975 [Bacteroidales bacterium]|jgi:ATP-dependent DNA helicase RecG|nr:hypothetical protein [Bacteroidales bacterium]
MGRSEELGTGMRSIYKYSKAYSGNKNVIFDDEDIFVTIVPVPDGVSDRVPDEVSEIERVGNNKNGYWRVI